MPVMPQAPALPHTCNSSKIYLASLASILVYGFNNSTLNYTILPMKIDQNKGEQWTIHNILMDTEWCVQYKWQNPGHILMLTTKTNLEAGWEWLDDNLPTIFTKYLPKNQCYQPATDNLIPYQTDICLANATLDNYMDKLCKCMFNHSPAPPPHNLTTHLHPTPLGIILSYSTTTQKNPNLPAIATETPGKRRPGTPAISTATNHSHKTVQMSMTMTATANLKQEILIPLWEEVIQMLKKDLQPLQNDTNADPRISPNLLAKLTIYTRSNTS